MPDSSSADTALEEPEGPEHGFKPLDAELERPVSQVSFDGGLNEAASVPLRPPSLPPSPGREGASSEVSVMKV